MSSRSSNALKPAASRIEQARVLAYVTSAERRWGDACCLPRENLARELIPIKSSIDNVDVKVDRLEMKIDTSAAEVKREIMCWTVTVWFLQLGFFTALLLKLSA